MATIGNMAYAATSATVALVLVCGGCASKPDQATTVPTAGADAIGASASANATGGIGSGSGPSGPTTRPSQAGVTITISISGDTVSPPPGRVEVAAGQTVHIEVSSDHNDEIHVHGYDIEVPVTPGTPATISFVADRGGLFEVESHHPAALLTQLLVR